MRRFLTLILICCLAVVPFIFSGCGTEYSAAQIFSRYESIRSGLETSEFFTTNSMKVTFNSANINQAKYETNSPSYILFHVYEPMLMTASEMFVSKAGLTSFNAIVSDFSVASRNSLYETLGTLNSKLKKLKTAKELFDSTNNASSGHLGSLLGSYSEVLSTVISLNTTFAKGYYKNELSKRNYTTATAASIVKGEVVDVITYNKLLITEVVYKYYVKNFTVKLPPESQQSWLNAWTYIDPYLTQIKRSTAGGDVKAGNREDLKLILLTLQNTYETYIMNKSLFTKSLKDFNYKEYYEQTINLGYNKDAYMAQQSEGAKASFILADNFMKTFNSARIGGVEALIDLFTN